MGVIAKKLRHIIKFDIFLATQQAIKNEKQKVINMNKQQLNDGLRSNGEQMPPYTELSLSIKRIEGVRVPRNQRFSLKHSGKFHEAMFLNAERTFFEISTSDPRKIEKLIDQIPSKRLQDKDVFGLTPDNIEVLNQQILIPHYQRKLRI